MTTVFDPVRKLHVAATPEEGVRQAVIRYLLDTLGVPANLMGVEFSLASLDPGNLRRADIVVWKPGRSQGGDGQLIPWLLVECKAPGIPIDDKVAYQVANYLGRIPCAFLMLSNGMDTRYMELVGSVYRPVPALPFFPKK